MSVKSEKPRKGAAIKNSHTKTSANSKASTKSNKVTNLFAKSATAKSVGRGKSTNKTEKQSQKVGLGKKGRPSKASIASNNEVSEKSLKIDNSNVEKSKQANSSASRALHFNVTRKRNAYESAEDYTELVADLIKTSGEARICKMADHLGVSHVTALRTVRRLMNEGYLHTDRHKPVYLTDKGKKLAKEAKSKHQVVESLLLKLGVPTQVASSDAEGIEHHLSTQTINAFKRFINS
jgi:DtxR family transcriptional regulator, manganese transport regulator